MARQFSVAVGSQVWVEDPDVAWIDGEVLEVKGDEIKISCTSGKTVNVPICNVHPKDPEASPCGVDDMTKLAYLHEPGVLQNLRSRYDMNEIYTYTGNILIAVNPFRRLPHLYDSHMMEQYKGAGFGELSPNKIMELNKYGGSKLTQQEVDELIVDFTSEEIWLAANGRCRGKSPGPDGYNLEFHRKRKISDSGGLTQLVLIQKQNPRQIGDFRPIVLCNVVHDV